MMSDHDFETLELIQALERYIGYLEFDKIERTDLFNSDIEKKHYIALKEKLKTIRYKYYSRGYKKSN